MLWSREPWERVDDLGHSSMPPGRFVSGVTPTPVGEATVMGICIPWFGSRTETRRGSERKRQWEDHALYPDCLSDMLKGEQDGLLIIVGDFNQRIGQGGFVPPIYGRRYRARCQSM